MRVSLSLHQRPYVHITNNAKPPSVPVPAASTAVRNVRIFATCPQRVPGGARFTCDFITSASSWRHEHPETPEKEEAFKAVVAGAVLAMEAALQADTLPPQGYWPTMKRELADRIAAQEPPPQPAQPPAAAPDALAQVPAAE